MKKIFAVCCLLFAICAAAHGIGLNADEPKTIDAEKIEYDVKAKSIKTIGQTTITNKSGQKITLVDAYLGDKNVIASGERVRISLSARTLITADVIDKQDNITLATNATYTTCNECDENINAWEITASKLKHDNDVSMLTFYNPVLWFYDVPVFWFPRMEHPDPTVKYKSGILFPTLNSTPNMGTQINLPLYLNFSDYHDATVTFSYLTGENMLYQAEHRLNADHSEFKTRGSYTHTSLGLDRWHVFNNDSADLGEHARAFAFINRASDKTYLQQYDFYNDQPFLDSGARLELFESAGYVTTGVHFFQELRTLSPGQSNPSGNILPNIHGVYQTEPVFGNTYFSFFGDVLGLNKTGSASQRLIGSGSVVSPWILPLGQKFTLAASARYDIYSFMNSPVLFQPNDFSGFRGRFLPSAYAEWSLPFIRTGDDWSHVIEPKVRLTLQQRLSTPALVNNDSSGSLLSDAMLFADNRLSGYDVWSNGTYADYGLNWTAFSKSDFQSDVFLGQSYDFFAPQNLDPNSGFHDGFSDYVGRLEFSAQKWFSLKNRFRFSEDGFKMRHLESIARVGEANYVEAGYIRATQLNSAYMLDKMISEAVLGFGTNLTGRLSFQTRVTYNITDDRIQRLNAGLYYDHPCYTMSLEFAQDGARRLYYQPGESYFGGARVRFQFALKLTEDK